jgi:hypothetical protein
MDGSIGGMVNASRGAEQRKSCFRDRTR